jgi:hypothetical protein
MIAKWVAVLLLASPPGLAAAQQSSQPQPAQQQSQGQEESQQQDPLAAAARRAREQKKDQPRPAKVWDNDNIPKSPEQISILGEPAPSSENAAKPADQSAAPSAAKEPEESAASIEERKAALQKELDQAKAHLKSVTTDLDIASRTYQLDQQTFYSNPNYSSDTQGADKLKNEESDIDAKKQEVADLQKNVDDLTSKLQELESEASKPDSTPK